MAEHKFQRSQRRITRAIQGIPLHIFLILLSIFFIFPFFWMITAAFKTNSELLGSVQSFLPSKWTFDNFQFAFETVPLWRNLFNSFFIAISYTILAVFFTSLGGFAFAKYDFPGRKYIFIIMLGTMMVPQAVGIVPSFILMKEFHWIDTYWSVIIPGTAHAFGIFFFRQYIRGVSDELLDAARIDGCNDFQIYYRVVLPVITPALITMAIMDFIGSWNSYLWPLIVLRSLDMYTSVLAITAFPAPQFRPPWGAIMAGTTISVLPLIIVFVLLQRYFVSGLMTGSVRG
jgi:ABC-type glycerol-3-phosphate transport system permease component